MGDGGAAGQGARAWWRRRGADWEQEREVLCGEGEGEGDAAGPPAAASAERTSLLRGSTAATVTKLALR